MPPSPLEAARGLVLEGRETVFLDSSRARRGAISLVASDPDTVVEGDDWSRLEAELERRRCVSPDLGLPTGAAIGWVAYDGRFRFGFFDHLHVFSHESEKWNDLPACAEPAPARAMDVPFRPRLRQEAFEGMVRDAQEKIAAGDIYQVCLSHPFEARGRFDAWAYYEALREISPVPHGAFLQSPGLAIASASPELFLRLSGRRVTTRPIKGTRPRRSDPDNDERNALELQTSAKEISELVMITDLERNDLGRVCEYGTVSVPELLKLERYEQVFHLVSTVRGFLREDVSHVAALRACFPGGSISGAPKRRAMEIIADLEPGPRGLYTGAIGYFGYNGESQFSITIRTALFGPDSASFHVGAGIVADSDPRLEWMETLHKASGLLQAGRPGLRR